MTNNWLIDREALENRLGRGLTETEWATIADEVAGRVDNFIEEILDGIVEEAIK